MDKMATDANIDFITYDGKIHILKLHEVKFKDQQILSV